MSKLITAETTDGASAYKISDLFSDLNGAILSELKSGAAIDVYRRNLQKAYVEKLIAIAKPAPAAAATALPGAATRGLSATQSDVMSVVKGQLRDIQGLMKSAGQSDTLSKYHLMDLNHRIEAALSTKD